MESIAEKYDDSTVSMVTGGAEETVDMDYSMTFKAASISILLFLMVLIIGVNSLVILAFAGNHIPRTKSNFYLLQLAIADVGVGVVMPVNVVSIAVNSFARNSTFCVLETAITMCVVSGSTCCNLGLTLDRLEALTKSVTYSSDMTTQ
ncbi:hypothetical protein CAPTEDRAFT_190684, partial [Capitella teleta]